jgi:hypothetical protein
MHQPAEMARAPRLGTATAEEEHFQTTAARHADSSACHASVWCAAGVVGYELQCRSDVGGHVSALPLSVGARHVT